VHKLLSRGSTGKLSRGMWKESLGSCQGQVRPATAGTGHGKTRGVLCIWLMQTRRLFLCSLARPPYKLSCMRASRVAAPCSSCPYLGWGWEARYRSTLEHIPGDIMYMLYMRLTSVTQEGLGQRAVWGHGSVESGERLPSEGVALVTLMGCPENRYRRERLSGTKLKMPCAICVYFQPCSPTSGESELGNFFPWLFASYYVLHGPRGRATKTLRRAASCPMRVPL
jgi:hypothetical protein